MFLVPTFEKPKENLGFRLWGPMEGSLGPKGVPTEAHGAPWGPYISTNSRSTAIGRLLLVYRLLSPLGPSPKLDVNLREQSGQGAEPNRSGSSIQFKLAIQSRFQARLQARFQTDFYTVSWISCRYGPCLGQKWSPG